jgi:dienelactone hydrolase
MTSLRVVFAVILAVALNCLPAFGQTQTDKPSVRDKSRGDRMIAEYFRIETEKLASGCLADVKTADDWKAHRDEYRAQLFEMLGLDPLPERTPLETKVTGVVEHDQFRVERVQFQSRPGLYVTGNLYVPTQVDKPLPAILYVCGHGLVKKDGISFGNKAHYQHHGAWFARNGYVCLTIDTLQMGEIEGIHHGTYKYDMWWWNSRGYTSAGVEAWNCIRALDYLETRPEIVDATRIGVTGRSGGGAYSWWIAALDERIKVAVPVAGITDLRNHVIDGTVEGHCDCMFMVNTYRWDYAKVAALVAPRPLLISNTDKDGIFPLDGVVRVHDRVRKIYRLLGADKNLGLQITEGPHADTQELHIHAFRWFNRFLKNDTALVEKTAVKFFQPEQLRVFADLPTDQINTKIQETFVATAKPPEVPASAEAWSTQRDGWLKSLREKTFRGWPDDTELDARSLDITKEFDVEREGIRFAAYNFISQPGIRLRLYVAHRAGLTHDKLDLVVLNALDEGGWSKWLAGMQVGFAEQLQDESLPAPDAKAFDDTRKMFQSFAWGMAYVAPRGIGPTAWDQSPKKQTQHRRRFLLLGQTLDSMRVWDVRRAAQTLRAADTGGFHKTPLWLQGEHSMSVVSLYASLFEPNIARLDLWHLPPSHQSGPDLLNVLRYLDLPQTLAMAAERSSIRIYQENAAGWEFPQAVATKLGWDAKRIQVRALPSAK